MIDELSITVKGNKIQGWTSVHVTRGLDSFPMSIDVEMTEKFPGTTKIVVAPGDACVVKMGNDTVLTGFIDRYYTELSANSHSMHISGRSKCEDLADCSAYFGVGGETIGSALANNQTMVQIAEKLVAPFKTDIKVIAKSGNGDLVPKLGIGLGPTPYQILSQLAKWNQQLIYDDEDGNLVFAQASKESMAGILQEGTNIQSCSIQLSMDHRYSDYFIEYEAIMDFTHIPPGKNPNLHGRAQDEEVIKAGRFRPLYTISQLTDATRQGTDLGQKIATWQRNRRFGEGHVLSISVATWRDQAGKLWQPNKLMQCNVPSMKFPTIKWLIASVTFRRDLSGGTMADLTLMPPEAFNPEPTNLITVDRDLIAANQADEFNKATGGAPT